MTTQATFLRLLDTPIAEKGDRLLQQIADLNAARPTADVFPTDSNSFSSIPSSPFAYWASSNLKELFKTYPLIGDGGRKIKQGLATADDFRFIRIWWEVLRVTLQNESRPVLKDWLDFAKGGKYSPFYYDVNLKVNWTNHGEEIASSINPVSGKPYSNIWMLKDTSVNYFLRSGLTWPLRTTSGISIRPLPKNCLFSHKGPSLFVVNDDISTLLSLMAVMNSKPFMRLIELQLGAATAAARSYEVGIIQQTPVPENLMDSIHELASLSLSAYKLAIQPSLHDETSRIFCLPSILCVIGDGLLERIELNSQSEIKRQDNMIDIQSQVDSLVSTLYDVPEFIKDNLGNTEDIIQSSENISLDTDTDDDYEDELGQQLFTPYSLISDFLMWCVGCAFGRWDIHYALNPETLPTLPEPFDPLPVCSPGMLQGADSLPLEEAPKDYPLSIASHGFLVDDPDRPLDDIVAAVRRVLHLLFGANADSIESEACQILEVPDLRAWFRDPKGFFAWHTKRYSKSRRKAPIYWLMQSAKKNYAIWLYYPRLNPDSLFYAAREYADAKLNLETARLEDLQGQLKALGGSSLKAQEKKVAAQTALVAEVKTYLKELDAAAMLQLKPDLNDGVLLNMAPLREIVPWKEPARAWDELLRGKYPWSHISAQLRKKGIVK